MGSLLFYPNIEELKNLVICDPQVVFDSVIRLLIQTFKTDDTASKRFKETGIFKLTDIEKAVTEKRDEYLPPAKLIRLLEYLNIVAPITHSKATVEYFFPAILNCATNEQLQKLEQTKEPSPLPLMIHFKSGFVPVGLFCATIASLVSQIYRHELRWMFMRPCDTLDNEPLYKNKITFTFCYEDSYDITLMSRPKRFEVHLTQTGNIQDYQTAKDCCARVLQTICDTLDNVISQIKHLNPTTSTNEAIYQLGFKCPILSHIGRNDLILNKLSIAHLAVN